MSLDQLEAALPEQMRQSLRLEKQSLEQESHDLSLKGVAHSSEVKPHLLQRALQLLHLWGDCIYFYSRERMRSIVCLRFEYIAKDTLAALFKPKNCRGTQGPIRRGLLKHEHLPMLWSSLGLAPEMIEHVYDFLQLFHTCFVLNRTKPFVDQVSIIPSLLGSRKIDIGKIWPETLPDGQNFECFFDLAYAVLPPFLFSNYISTQYAAFQKILEASNSYDFEQSAGKLLLWKDGAIFNSGEQQVFISEDAIGQRIVLRVRGCNKEACFGVLMDLRASMLQLEKPYAGLSLQVRAPCPLHLDDPLSSCLVVLPKFASQESSAVVKCPTTTHPVSLASILQMLGANFVANSSNVVSFSMFQYALDQQTKHQIPSVYMLLPPSKTASLGAKLKRLTRNISVCHCMCEFQYVEDSGGVPLFHPTGMMCEVSEPKKLVQKLMPVLKATVVALKVARVLSPFPIPDVAELLSLAIGSDAADLTLALDEASSASSHVIARAEVSLGPS